MGPRWVMVQLLVSLGTTLLVGWQGGVLCAAGLQLLPESTVRGTELLRHLLNSVGAQHATRCMALPVLLQALAAELSRLGEGGGGHISALGQSAADVSRQLQQVTQELEGLAVEETQGGSDLLSLNETAVPPSHNQQDVGPSSWPRLPVQRWKPCRSFEPALCEMSSRPVG